jgi:choline kinase
MAHECVILADWPGALIELCGISTLERLLRTLQRCGIERATILSSTSERIADELTRPSWPRAQLSVTIRDRPAEEVTVEEIVDIWPEAAPLLLVLRGDVVFDSRLLQLLARRSSPAVLVDSAVPLKLQPLGGSGSERTLREIMWCGATATRLGLDPERFSGKGDQQRP